MPSFWVNKLRRFGNSANVSSNQSAPLLPLNRPAASLVLATNSHQIGMKK